ncbi:toll/interleukin-1 receptor domain-containing protein [Taibaiella koreensis]|uniref:toll/interleukin-1 receptor domain-containing protein n=1 Tax=Taibaiella koreensis TaxID=1268548 RepID=UPI000E59AFE0|nr:toll/interleukin-1 receptor domain-containing protein [Taibaiella koreensis]
MENKKVFISYSWSTPAHEDWVVELANRLVQDGVDVALDKWDLKEGHDKYHFMESMVKSPDIFKVLIILDKKYSERANDRKGGVGTETMIISPELYNDVVQEKFIPVVTEVDENGKAFLPVFLSARIYIDLSDKDHFEANYEKLLRSIFSRPSLTKPSLGKPPKYLFDDSPIRYKTTAMARGLEALLDKNPFRANSYLTDFLEEYFENLKQFKLDRVASNSYLDVGEAVYNKFNQYKLLKADYIDYIGRLIKSGVLFDHDLLLHFFERLPMLLSAWEDDSSNLPSYSYDHFKLIIHELFLYTVGLALKYNSFQLLADVFHSRYFIKDKYARPQESNNFTKFRYYYETMDQFYKKHFGRNYYSPHADYITINVPEGVSPSLIVNADLLCYYIAQLNDWTWFPITYIYRRDERDAFDFLSRLVSKKHFEKIKGVLGIDNIDVLKLKMLEINAQGKDRGYTSGLADPIPGFNYYIKVDDIAISA